MTGFLPFRASAQDASALPGSPGSQAMKQFIALDTLQIQQGTANLKNPASEFLRLV